MFPCAVGFQISYMSRRDTILCGDYTGLSRVEAYSENLFLVEFGVPLALAARLIAPALLVSVRNVLLLGTDK